MIIKITEEDDGDISKGALRISVFFAGTRHPREVVQNVDFTYDVIKAKETWWIGWNKIILIGDTCDGAGEL